MLRTQRANTNLTRRRWLQFPDGPTAVRIKACRDEVM